MKRNRVVVVVRDGKLYDVLADDPTVQVALVDFDAFSVKTHSVPARRDWHLSDAGKRKIAAAQRARWVAYRKAHSKAQAS